MQVRPTGVADQQGVTREDEPRLVGARVVGDQVGVMGGGVPRRRESLHRRVAELDALAVLERDVVEVDAGAGAGR